MFLVTVFPLYSLTTLLESSGVYTDMETLPVKFHLLPFAYIFQTATIWVTVLVGFNRYIAVCHPFKVCALIVLIPIHTLYVESITK